MITILFATHNGEKTLPLTLKAFCNLTVPEIGWEIIVVDNASTDNTANIIKSYIDKLPIRYLYEDKKGKNNALNSGVSLAKGNLIVFTDDDVIPEQEWLVKLASCANLHADYTIFGGVIKPNWPRQPDKWIIDHVPLGATYAITKENLEEGDISPGSVWGPNMAIRREVFDAGHRFDTSVGPNGKKNYAMGSETEFTIRLHKVGYKSWFCRDAVVQHIIRDYQLDPKWIVERAYRLGRSMYRQKSATYNPNIPLLFGVPRWMFRKLIDEYFKYSFAFLTRNRIASFYASWEISFILGYFSESKR